MSDWDWRNDPVVGGPSEAGTAEWDWQNDPIVSEAPAESPQIDPKLAAAIDDRKQQEQDPEIGRTLRGYERFRWLTGRVPFMRSAIEGAENTQLIGAFDRIKNGVARDEDYGIAADALARMDDKEKQSWLSKTGEMIATLPAYGTEFATTGGAFNAGRAVVGGAAKAALGGAAKSAAGRLAVNAASGLGGVAAQTAMNPALVAAGASERMRPETSLQFNESGEIVGLDIQDGEALLEALPKGYLDAMIEVGTERAGGHLLNIPGIKQLAGGTGALKNAITKRWLSKPGRTSAMLDETLKQIGWHGMLGEVLEERAGDVARLATGLESPGQNVAGLTGLAAGALATGDTDAAMRYGGQAASQLASEAVAFSVPGAVNAASRVGRPAQQPTLQETPTGAALPPEITPESPPDPDAEFREQLATAPPPVPGPGFTQPDASGLRLDRGRLAEVVARNAALRAESESHPDLTPEGPPQEPVAPLSNVWTALPEDTPPLAQLPGAELYTSPVDNKRYVRLAGEGDSLQQTMEARKVELEAMSLPQLNQEGSRYGLPRGESKGRKARLILAEEEQRALAAPPIKSLYKKAPDVPEEVAVPEAVEPAAQEASVPETFDRDAATKELVALQGWLEDADVTNPDYDSKSIRAQLLEQKLKKTNPEAQESAVEDTGPTYDMLDFDKKGRLKARKKLPVEQASRLLRGREVVFRKLMECLS